MSGPGKMPAKKQWQTFTREEHGELVEYKVGDNVLIKPAPPTKMPFIGIIREIHEPVVGPGGESTQNVTVNWYYRPNEVVGGRKQFHGSAEVFESDHTDTCDVSTIIQHCEVLSLDDYLELDYVTPNTFFTRYFYSASKREFQPDRVMVYCSCQLPYNPDMPMVMCEKCEEWFHLACLGLEEEEEGGFICAHCGGISHAGHRSTQPTKRPKTER